MKTSVTLHSPDRTLFGITVRQQTGNGFLSLSDLQNAYNIAAAENGWSEKKVQDFLKFQDNKERLYELLLATKKVNSPIHEFTSSLEESPAKYLKSLGVWKTTRAEGVMVDPYVWVSIAMWMNPKIYAKVIIWLTDSLLFNRVNAGGLYTELTAQLATLGYEANDYAETARAINFVAIGRHESGIRQVATSEQLAEIADIEKKLAYAIEAGYITEKHMVIDELRNMWDRKFGKSIRTRKANQSSTLQARAAL